VFFENYAAGSRVTRKPMAVCWAMCLRIFARLMALIETALQFRHFDGRMRAPDPAQEREYFDPKIKAPICFRPDPLARTTEMRLVCAGAGRDLQGRLRQADC
jgi:hypothetical protein